MWCLVTCFVIVLLLHIQVQRAATYENSHQYPVDYPVFGDDYEDPTSMHTKRVGEACLNSDECQRELCCLRRNSERSCQPRAKYCSRCSEYQMMGGYYHDYCPCSTGAGECHTFRNKNYGICYFRKRRS
ncbi:U-scoloptoxin(18)-Er1a [Rhipicephalus sanguineus]|uniref:U-scoloptoxin(18)-Er1a n=1 Tax=Rhipicephalus sanguineus TaxID=34632 RepID=UPI0020C39196|nr:U-scoloptoxin(18)-Er1a [Rhipicephalus sanguineus]